MVILEIESLNPDNNNINMNMNTGRAMKDLWAEEIPTFPDKDDIWGSENLKLLIDMKIVGCDPFEKRRSFVDSIFLRDELGGDFLSASCKAVRKMMIFFTQITTSEDD